MRRALCLLVALLTLSVLPSAMAEEEVVVVLTDEEREFARAQLIEEARRKVGSMRPTPERLRGIRDAIGADIRFLTSYEPKEEAETKLLEAFDGTIQERLLLVGREGEGREDPGTPGAILEAVILTRWLDGEEPCYVTVTEPTDTPEQVGVYPFPQPPPAAASPEKPPTDDAEAQAPAEPGAGLGPAPSGPPPGEIPAAPPAEGKTPKGEGPPAAAGGAGPSAEAAPKPVPPAPQPDPMDPRVWAETVVLAGEGGTLRGKRIYPGECTTVDDLLRAARTPPVYQHPEVGRLVRHAIGAKDIFAYNLPSIEVRRVQSKEMLTVLEADVPSRGLVDETMVDLKAQRARNFRGNVTEIAEKQKQLRGHLDQMVEDHDAWKTQAALLSREIEDERASMKAAAEAAKAEAAKAEAAAEAEAADGVKADAAAGGDAPAPAEPGKDGAGAAGATEPEPPEKTLMLRLAEARESLVGQELRLFYLTVLRTQRRLELLDRLRRVAESEATAAESVYTRFEEELVRIRNERRLGRLRSSERQLRSWIRTEQANEPSEGSAGAQRIVAYQAVLEVNLVAQDAVNRRRALTGRGTAAEAERAQREEERTNADEAKAKTPADVPAQAPGTGGKVEQKQLNVLMLSPQLRTWDEKFIETAHRELQDPELEGQFNASLVAEHYDAVNDRIIALAESLKAAPNVPEMRAEFGVAEAKAAESLAPLERDYLSTVVRRLPGILKSCREDCDSAMQGIEDQITRNRTRLAQLLNYREALTRLGTRSLLVREGRTLDNAELAAALEEIGGSVDVATTWLGSMRDEHIGGFVKRRWLRILLVLGIAVGMVFLVRAARRRVDRWIEARAAVDPELQGTGVSVEQEKEELRRRKEEEAAARAAASTEVLEKVREDLDTALAAAKPPEPEPDPTPDPTPDPEAPPEESAPEDREPDAERKDPLSILDEEELARRVGTPEPDPRGSSPSVPQAKPAAQSPEDRR